MIPDGIRGAISAPESGHVHDAVRDAAGEVWARRECRDDVICMCILGRGHWDSWEPVTVQWGDRFMPDEPAGGVA